MYLVSLYSCYIFLVYFCSEVLGAFDNEDVLIKLPAGRKLSEATYISVWCQEFSVYFAGVDIPAGFNSPKPQVIGQFSELAHSVRSGNVTVLDDRTIHIKDLHYDGLGPGKYILQFDIIHMILYVL